MIWFQTEKLLQRRFIKTVLLQNTPKLAGVRNKFSKATMIESNTISSVVPFPRIKDGFAGSAEIIVARIIKLEKIL